MIYDCFPFFTELDVLEIRLNELNSVVDKFVLVEAELSHNGDCKPLYYAENKSRFEKFASKIVHVILSAEDFSPANVGTTFQERAWMRENIQRNAIIKGLTDAKEDDVVIVSDLDEIPRANKVREVVEMLKSGEVVGFALKAYTYYINLRNASVPVWGNDPKMATIQTFRNEASYSASPYCHFVLKSVNMGYTATRFRYIKPTKRICDAGWHFSYCGGEFAILKKMRSIVENEWTLNMEDADLMAVIKRKLLGHKTLVGGNHLIPEPLDGSFPSYLVNNQEKYAKLIFQNVQRQGVRMRLLRRWYYVTACIRRFFMRLLFIITPKWVRAIMKKVMGVAT